MIFVIINVIFELQQDSEWQQKAPSLNSVTSDLDVLCSSIVLALLVACETTSETMRSEAAR